MLYATMDRLTSGQPAHISLLVGRAHPARYSSSTPNLHREAGTRRDNPRLMQVCASARLGRGMPHRLRRPTSERRVPMPCTHGQPPGAPCFQSAGQIHRCPLPASPYTCPVISHCAHESAVPPEHMRAAIALPGEHHNGTQHRQSPPRSRQRAPAAPRHQRQLYLPEGECHATVTRGHFTVT